MISSLLSVENYWIVNKPIARFLKCNDSALLLSELANKQDYYQSRGELNKDGFFYYKSEDLEQSLNIGYSVQKKCIAKLLQAGFIEYNRKGTLGKSHFKVNEVNIFNFLNSRITENVNLKLVKREISTINNNTINKERINDDDKYSSSTLKSWESIKKERGIDIPIKELFEEILQDDMYIERLRMGCSQRNVNISVPLMKEYIYQVYLLFKFDQKVETKDRKDGYTHVKNIILKDIAGNKVLYNDAVKSFKNKQNKEQN